MFQYLLSMPLVGGSRNETRREEIKRKEATETGLQNCSAVARTAY